MGLRNFEKLFITRPLNRFISLIQIAKADAAPESDANDCADTPRGIPKHWREFWTSGRGESMHPCVIFTFPRNSLKRGGMGGSVPAPKERLQECYKGQNKERPTE